MICNAGVSGGKVPISLIISLNYFGATEMARGVFDLLEKKGGSCVVTSSNSIAQGAARMDVAGMLNNHADEDRILELVKDVDPAIGHVYYASTKYALARWVRRMSRLGFARRAPERHRTRQRAHGHDGQHAARAARGHGGHPRAHPFRRGTAHGSRRDRERHGVHRQPRSQRYQRRGPVRGRRHRRPAQFREVY